jgi:hypothetical protein
MNNFSKFSDVCKKFDEGEKHKTETFINRNGNKRKDLNRNSATSKTMYSTRNGSRKKMISCSFKPRKEPSFESVKDVQNQSMHFVINLKLVEEGQRQRILGDDEIEGEEFYIAEPDEVIKPLSVEEMAELQNNIEEYLRMEKSPRNREFWQAIMTILTDFQTQSTSAPENRVINTVADDIDALLGSKTYEQHEALESQAQGKLDGDEPVDVDY